MTFSQTAKNEVLNSAKNLKGCCADAFLYAVFKTVGEYALTKNGIALTISNQNLDFLHCVEHLVKTRYGFFTEIDHETTSKMLNADIYCATFDSALLKKYCLTFFDKNGLLQINDGVSKKYFSKDCCTKAFLMGVFVAVGSITVPVVSLDLTESKLTQRYHMEFSLSKGELAQLIYSMLKENNLEFKQLERKSAKILYTKSSETIADILVFLTATNAKLELENLIIERSIRNNANRQSNCIYANIDKMLTASQKQLDAVEKLNKSGKIHSLTEELKQTALLRQQNPEASLSELSQICGLTKSCLKHRLNKLVMLGAEETTEEI